MSKPNPAAVVAVLELVEDIDDLIDTVELQMELAAHNDRLDEVGYQRECVEAGEEIERANEAALQRMRAKALA
ncbi:MAG: hypothetical protein Q8O67_32000 [Deltaproteobacteria bacterium]|nr:hypothetical protein [Deltaproteobacteria bacterium]